jgi:hypothetical protein
MGDMRLLRASANDPYRWDLIVRRKVALRGNILKGGI